VGVPRPRSRVGIALAAFSVVVSLLALLVLLAMRLQPHRPLPDFTAGPDPVVSSMVVDRPPGPAGGAPDDASSLPSDDGGQPVQKPSVGPRPPRPPGPPPKKTPPSTPRFNDIPHY